jgi:glyoxylase-like metal-dependent hydrolase (beta-lactamase superfamily II)
VFFRQYNLACLSLFSYMIGDTATGRAVVVDPQRDVGQYLADAEAAGLRIERVIETHFHADFVSGHLELARATGAAISYGDQAAADFPIDPLAHRQRLPLGDVTLEVRHTPGHTPESISVVVYPRPEAEPWAVLSGDTLFIGDVGRPDLLTSIGWTAEDLARDLYRSLHTELLTLPDEALVFPAHGAGSACGKHLETATSSTIGAQRATNYALRPMTVDAFVDAVTDGQGAAPLYFAFAADANRRSRRSRWRGRGPSSWIRAPLSRSHQVTCAAQSTSVSTAASPSTPAMSSAPTSRSCWWASVAGAPKPRSGLPVSASTPSPAS